MKFADFPLRGQGGGKDFHYAFFGNVVRGKSALFWLVVRNGFAHYVRKVFAYRMLLPGKFWVFPPLPKGYWTILTKRIRRVCRTVMGELHIRRSTDCPGEGRGSLS